MGHQWNNDKLRKQSQMLDWLAVGFAMVLLVVYFVDANPWVLLIPAIASVVCYMLSWQMKRKDAKLKKAKKVTR